MERLIELAIMEDYSAGDATTEALISPDIGGKATIVSDESGVLAGLDIALEVFHKMAPDVKIERLLSDGNFLETGSRIANIQGPLGSILTTERTSLNFLRKLSGVATETSKYVEAIKGTSATIIDTRKTTPGFRSLQKYAVRMGGGTNHRQNLGDGILIKDNHIRTLALEGMSLKDVIKKAHANASHTIKIEVEVEDLAQVKEALESGAQIILLDNMTPIEMGKAVALCGGKAITEASGGINLSSVRAVAESGVDLISVGALTHSAPDLDISLDIE
ncbi:MAG: nicotinate-nucleotide diphosphorylase (carboxylating) [Chloroflexi bacterium]|nr:nicotinate-nucleotide diphosphorylase (carboxylating) [Chloroflexota bacterium]MQG02044.1 carboxylating nicotinate-nucleotide diphosphorylase [SAR202 cluster bacterium]